MTRPSPQMCATEMARLGRATGWGLEELIDLSHADRRWLLAHAGGDDDA